MPVFDVTAPDGKVFEVNTPEGGTEQDAIRYLASTYNPELNDKSVEGGYFTDLMKSGASGVLTGIRGIIDVLGAENPISQKIKGGEEYLAELLSAQAKKEDQKIAEIFERMDNEGALEQFMSALEAFSVAPSRLIAQGLGTAVPFLIGGLLGAGARTIAGLGAAQGVGITKDAIYQATKEELLNAKVSEDEAERIAQEAQSYAGKNIDQLGLGALTGLLGSVTGIEKRLIPSLSKNVLEKSAKKSILRRTGETAITEAVPEFLQGGQERLSQNIALQREGFETPTMQGVFGQGAFEAFVGAGLGAGVGAITPGREAPPVPPVPPAPPAPSVEFEQETLVGPPPAETRVPIPGIQADQTGLTAGDFLTRRQALQQQAAQQFGLYPPDVEAAPPAPTPFALPSLTPQVPPQVAPAVSADLSQQRLEKQQAAAQQFPDLAAPTGTLPPLATPEVADVTPSQVPLRPSVTPGIPQPLGEADRTRIEAVDAQATDRKATIDRLRQQAETDPTEQGRQTALLTLGQMLQTPAQPRFIELQPMSLPQATARLNVLKSESPSANLNVVAHPSIPNAFAIEDRPVAPLEPETEAAPSFAERRQQALENQQRIELAAMRAPTTPDLEEEARQVIISRALQNIEERGGVASPAEAQILREAKLGTPYSRIDPGLAPKGTADQQLTFLALQPRPKEAVTEPARQERQQLEDLIEETGQPAPLPDPNRVIEALRTPTVARSAEQVSTVNLARSRYAPSDIAVLERAADGTMTGEDASRLNTIEQMGARFSLSDEVSPETKSIADEVRKKLLPALKKFGLGNVALRLLDTIDGGKANGSYLKQVISIALDSDNPMGVMRHEVIHALKELGAFTDAEWKVLSKRAREEWINRFIGPELVERYRQIYSDQNDGNMEGFQEYIEEEAIAEAFKYFDNNKPPAGMIANLMRRLNNMFQAIKKFFGAQGLTAEDIFLSNQIFRDIEAGRLQPGRAPQRGVTAPVFSLRDLPAPIRRAAEEVGLTENELLATSLPLQTGGRGDNTFKTDKVGGLTETIGFLENRRLDSGAPTLDIMNDQDHDQIAKLITAEAMAAIRAGGNALDWYDGVIQRTLNMASLKHPELATDINAGTAFKVAMAITSQGLNVEDNIKLADRIYTQYKRTGKFPEMGSGEAEPVMKNSFRRANDMINEMGFDDFRTFLETPFTVRDLQKATGLKISGEMLDERVLGSSIFGPKIGFGFYSNLNGNFEPVTMDMWFMRTIGRLTGKLRAFDETKVGKQIDRFVAAMSERGTDGIYANQFDKDLVARAKKEREAAMEFAKIVNRAHEKDFKVNRDQYNNKTRKKSALVNAAGAILKSLEKPIDAPTSGGQRRKLRAIFAKVRDNVRQLYGKDVPSASLQAVIWYPEQSLYKSLGVKLRVTNQDYAGAMRKILQEEGYDAKRISTAAELGSRGVQSRVQEPVSTGDQARLKTTGRANEIESAKPRFSPRPDKVAFRPSAQGDGARRDGRAGDQGGINSPLEGAPSFKGASGPDPQLVQVAKRYAESKGIPFGRQSVYADVDPVFGKSVADAYEAMRDDPSNPDVIEAYQDLIQQVKDQYNALSDEGYQFTFFDSQTDPYGGNPVNAMRDLRNNKKMAVYGSYDGYGQVGISPADVKRNPMLEDTGLRWVDQEGVSRPVLANDLFRAVHDAFGHGIEGAGFRSRGEENAFQAHAKLFTGKALGALASETRGQNSWLNFGPFGEQNQNAKVEDTVFAEQKVGLMPSWTWTENIVPDVRYSARLPDKTAFRPKPSNETGVSFNPIKEDSVSFQGSHYGKAKTGVLNGAKYGQGLRGAEAKRLAQSSDGRIKRRVYFYIPRSNNTMPNRESGVGSYVYTQKLDNMLAPGETMSRLNREAGGDGNKFESLVVDNGYDGYAVPDYGMMVVLNNDVPVNFEGTVADLASREGPPKFSLRPVEDLFASVDDKREVYYKDRSKLIRMNIDDFLALSEQLPNPYPQKKDRIKKVIAEGQKLESVPVLLYDAEGDRAVVSGHEGRHRAIVLKEMGYTEMPVEFRGNIRWSEQDSADKFDYKKTWPSVLVGQKPVETVRAFPVSREQSTEPYTNAAPASSPRFSLRPTAPAPKAVTKTEPFKRWFGKSKIVDAAGNPKIMYHGTARDIEEFRGKQAGAIFLTDDPVFAETFGDMSETYMAQEYFNNLNENERKKFIQEALKTERNVLKQQLKDKDINRKSFGEYMAMLDLFEERSNREGYPKTFAGIPGPLEVTAIDLAKDKTPSRANIMPLYVRAERPFDYANPDHVNEISQDLIAKIGKDNVEIISRGSWKTIETPEVQRAIREAGFDGFYVLEAGRKNLAVYNPNQIKSAIGNIGTFDDTGRIRYNLVEKPENAPPQLLTKTTPVQSAGKALQTAVKDTFDTIQDNEYWTKKRNEWVDQGSGLTQRLKDLPIFDSNGTLRADMLKHALAQVLNLIRTGIGSGIPFLNRDGTLSIQRSENNFSRSEILADALNTHPNVVKAGVSGKQYVAEIARALRGKDIIEEDKRLNALGVQQLEEAKGLYKEAKQAGKDGDFKRSRALLRQVARLRKEGYKNKAMKRELQVTPEQIKWAEEQLQKTPEVQGVLDIWKNINTALIDLWEAVGLLSPEQAQEYRDTKNYVPLFKSRDDLNNEKTFALAGVGAKTTAKLKKLEGSESIKNIWENLDKQYATMIAAAYENQTRRISVQQLEGLGGAKRTNISDPRGNLKFKENGQDVNVIVENPNVLMAFQTFSHEVGPVMKFFGSMTRVLRAGALINPMFWLRQLVRDPIHATLVANSGVITPFHAAGNFIQELIKGSPEGRLLAERGVIGQMDSTVDMNEFLTEAGRDRMQKPGVMQKTLHKLLQIHEASDAATRIAVFKRVKAKALKDGMSEEQAIDFAVFKARESINFSVKGMHPFLNSLRQMIPFINATIVGLDTLYRAATGYGLNPEERKEAMRQFRIKAGVMVGFATAYAMMYANDDDYNKLPDYVKDNNFLIPIGTGEDRNFIKLAIPYEVGFLFKTVPEVLVRYLSGNSTGKEMLASYWGGLLHNLPTGGTPIPQAVRPGLEVITNYSFFTGRPIEGMSDQGLPKAMRGDKASEFAKVLSRVGLDKLSLSPAQIDYLMQGYFAELGTFSTEMASSVLSYGQGKNPPEKNLYEMPFFRSFMTNPNSDKAVADFYEVTQTAQEVSRAFTDMANLGKTEEARAYLQTDENRMLVGAASALRGIRDEMSEVRQQIRFVRESAQLSPDEKNQQTKRLQDVFNTLARRGVEISESLGIR